MVLDCNIVSNRQGTLNDDSNVLTGELIADDKRIIIPHHSHRHPRLHIQTVKRERGTFPLPSSQTSQTFPQHQETTEARTAAEGEEEEVGETCQETLRLSSDESAAGDRAERGETGNIQGLQQLLSDGKSQFDQNDSDKDRSLQ